MHRGHIVSLWVALLLQFGLLLYLVWDQGTRQHAVRAEGDTEPLLEHRALEVSGLEDLQERIRRLEELSSSAATTIEAVGRRSTEPGSSDPTKQLESRVAQLEQALTKIQRQLVTIRKSGNAFNPNDPASSVLQGSPWSAGGRGEGKDTALTSAAARGDRDAVLEALRKGADINEKGKRGFTALTAALEAKHENLALELIKRGADVNALDGGDETALMWASYRGLLRASKRLLDRGARIDAASKTKNSALHDAVRSGNIEVVRLLLKRGAKFRHIDGSGKTPLRLANERGNAAIAALLRQWGAR